MMQTMANGNSCCILCNKGLLEQQTSIAYDKALHLLRRTHISFTSCDMSRTTIIIVTTSRTINAAATTATIA